MRAGPITDRYPDSLGLMAKTTNGAAASCESGPKSQHSKRFRGGPDRTFPPFRPRSFRSIFPMPAPKKPGRETRGKASRPELQPLDEHLAALLNPALVETKGFGEAPQQKFESAAPDSHPHGLSGTPASAESLKALLGLGDPNIRNRPAWTPHRPPRPDKSEGGRKLRSVSDYAPGGDQPQAIA